MGKVFFVKRLFLRIPPCFVFGVFHIQFEGLMTESAVHIIVEVTGLGEHPHLHQGEDQSAQLRAVS